jgi:L-ascorbate metabolism protein UlaG (beta-lactamase superfamily)
MNPNRFAGPPPSLTLLAVLVALLLLAAPVARAACPDVVAQSPRVIRIAAAGGAFQPERAEPVQIEFLGHASFLIETAGHVTAVTDYNGVNIPRSPPDIATMNHAHTTHYTDFPDPRIPHVLRGWAIGGVPPVIDLTVGDLHVWNRATNIRDFATGETQTFGNSIFVFEAAGLCIAHLSHLHHLLDAEDLAALGRIDVVMAPVDGGWTISHADIAAVIDQLHPALVIPMHYFTRSVLDRFLDLVRGRFAIRFAETPRLTLTQSSLPTMPEIIVLPGS